MSTAQPAPNQPERLTPEQQTEYWRERIADWDAFEATIIQSDEELDAWEQSGQPGLPPGYVSARDYLHRRAV